MSYDVEWSDEAIEQLGSILGSHHRLRSILVDDANRIDEVLASDPHSGSRDSHHVEIWVSQVGRLAVSYAIAEETERITVLAVKLSLA